MSAIFYENKVQNGTVKAVFEHLDSLVYAIDELKRAGLAHEMIATTPLPRHDVEHVAESASVGRELQRGGRAVAKGREWRVAVGQEGGDARGEGGVAHESYSLTRSIPFQISLVGRVALLGRRC